MQRCCADCGAALAPSAFRLCDGDDPNCFLVADAQLARALFALKPVAEGRTRVCCPCCDRALGAGFDFPGAPLQLVFDARAVREWPCGAAEAKLRRDLWAERERGRAGLRAQRALDLLEQTLLYGAERFLTLRAQTAAIDDRLAAALRRVQQLASRAFDDPGLARPLERRSPLNADPP